MRAPVRALAGAMHGCVALVPATAPEPHALERPGIARQDGRNLVAAVRVADFRMRIAPIALAHGPSKPRALEAGTNAGAPSLGVFALDLSVMRGECAAPETAARIGEAERAVGVHSDLPIIVLMTSPTTCAHWGTTALPSDRIRILLANPLGSP